MKLSDETIENLMIALAQATDEAGVPVHIPPEAAFTGLILENAPTAAKYFLEIPAHG